MNRIGCVLGAVCVLSGSAAEAGEPLDRALGLPDWLTVDLTHRLRYESLHNTPVAGRRGDDQLISPATWLKATIGRGPLKFVGEAVDARGYLDDSGSGLSSGTIDPIDLLQANLSYHGENVLAAGDKASVLAGRFTTGLGANRIIGKNAFRNITDSFTGVRADWTAPSGRTLTLLWALPVVRRPNDAAGLGANRARADDQDFDLELAAVQIAAPVVAGVSAEAYTVGLFERDDPAELETRNRRIGTAGLRLFAKPAAGKFDLDLEGAYQFGRARASARPTDVRDLDVSAGFVHAGLGYTFDAAWSPRLVLEYEYASGDRDPADGRYGRFDALFPAVRADLGPASLYSVVTRTNLSSPGARVETRPTAALDVFLDGRAVFLDAARDRFSGTGVVDPTGRSGRFAGTQVEARARYWLKKDRIRLEAGGAWFARGRFLKTAPNRNGEGDVAYGYTDVTLSF